MLRFLALVCLALHLVGLAQTCMGQGLMIPGVGAKNRSFGGAATGNALDTAGGLFFNPATLSQMQGRRIIIGVEIPFISESVSSSAFGSSGETDAKVGIFPLSTTALTYRDESLPELTYGLGMFSAGGLFGNYPADESNPVLSPPPPNGVGAGQLFNLLSLLQFTPAVAAQMTERLSIGGGPIITLATLQLAPVTLAPPDDANGDGFFSYPQAIGTHPHYGLGFQIGAFYKGDAGLNFGCSYKSPNWLEKIKINSHDEIGRPRPLTFHLDLPPVYSLGVSYEGLPCWLLAADIRYTDYNSVSVLSDSGFNPDGSVRGVGWESVWSLSLGVQRQLGEKASLRVGWFCTENPIPDALTAFNIGAPAYYTNIVSTGLSCRLSEAIALDLGYFYAPRSQISGPFVTPAGPLPGTQITDSVSSHSILMSLAFDY